MVKINSDGSVDYEKAIVTAVDETTVTFDIPEVKTGSTSGTYVVKFAYPAPFDDPALGVIDNRFEEYDWSIETDFRRALENLLSSEVDSAVTAKESNSIRNSLCGYN